METEQVIYNIIINLMILINTVQLSHWTTSKYSIHKSTDDFMDECKKLLDELTEVSIGSKEISKEGLKKYCIDKYKQYTLYKLENMKKLCEDNIQNCKQLNSKNTDIMNIKDEIIGVIHKFLYLTTFN